jgi:hypothetical protein
MRHTSRTSRGLVVVDLFFAVSAVTCRNSRYQGVAGYAVTAKVSVPRQQNAPVAKGERMSHNAILSVLVMNDTASAVVWLPVQMLKFPAGIGDQFAKQSCRNKR